MLESKFKKSFLQRVRARLQIDLDIISPDTMMRDYPDTFILGPDRWAALEFKRERNAAHQPNQDYHVARLNRKSFARFVYPENAEEVLDDLEELFTS